MKEHWIVDEPSGQAKASLILAHGAGAAMDTPFMDSLARAMAQGGVRVIRFEFPYMQQRRQDGRLRPPDRPPKLLAAWKEAIEDARAEFPSQPLFIGGKSMGGRIASMVADEFRVTGLICLGYPFHPPGRPQNLRTEHLEDLTTPTLILQGERDPFGKPEEIAGYTLSDAISVEYLPDGDHSFKPRKSSGHTLDENINTSIGKMREFIDGN
ncbi:MAG TPA: alpha/beta fold hydrolase [Acidobacteriota bacterium]|nr:alpha/beta fold hydrolase [Acidobacteriota bacterium]